MIQFLYSELTFVSQLVLLAQDYSVDALSSSLLLSLLNIIENVSPAKKSTYTTTMLLIIIIIIIQEIDDIEKQLARFLKQQQRYIFSLLIIIIIQHQSIIREREKRGKLFLFK